MKIGIDARCLNTLQLRGIGKYLYNLIINFSDFDNSHEILLFIDARYEEFKDIPYSKNIRKIKFAFKGDRFNLWEQFGLPFQIMKTKTDIFHGPANTVPLIQTCPTVITLHDTLLLSPYEGQSKMDLFYNQKIIPIAVKNAKKIITSSENSKKDIIRDFKVPEEKIKVIYLGINKKFRKIKDMTFLEKIINKYCINEKYLFALGASSPRKNISRLIDVFFMLKKEKNFSHKLLIAGIRPDCYDNYFNKVKELDLVSDVILIKYITEEELIALYNKAEIFIYPSLYEGFGFPVVEAMACGCPVVASNRSSIPELVGDAGLLVEPTDNRDILNKIFIIINNNILRNELIEKGLKKADLFTWKKTMEETFKVYEEVYHREKK